MQYMCYIMPKTYFVTELGKIHHLAPCKQSIAPAALELLPAAVEIGHVALVVEVILEMAAVAVPVLLCVATVVIVPAFFQCVL